jgi:TnpA family transposase
VATQVFADEELERLREYPEIGRDELFRFFTLTPADVAFVDPGRGRGPADRLGLAVTLCSLPWLGFMPDVTSAPRAAVARLGEQLKIDPVELRSYSRRAKTRTNHLRLVSRYLGWRPPTTMELKELDEFLLARALEHDSPLLLFRLACEYLISARVIRPGPVTVVERVAHAREEARRETFDRLAHEFTEARCAGLDKLGELEATLAPGDGPVRLDDEGDLVISPLTAEDVPAEATALKAELTELLPYAPIVSLLIELDGRTGFLDCFTHAGGKQARSSELKRNLIAVLLAQATNLGLTRMAEASGISYDILAWTSEWYVREDTLRAANLAIIGHHQTLPLTPIFGTGALSSSDGQRFPTRGKSVTARALSRYFANEGLSTYTHVTDQFAIYGTKIIVATKREAHFILDEMLGNAADIPVTEHATDTHGVTLVNFGLFDLVGLQLSPRIRDLGKVTLYRTGTKQQVEADYPLAGPLLTRKLNTELIAEHWDDLLRLAGSLKFGHATASLLVGKLSASSRQNTLATALKEYGALRRTIYAARYLSDPVYRRKISRQLNKGESIHALKRDLLYAHEGAFRARHLEAQSEQAWCLTLATNAVMAWTTEYFGLAVAAMRTQGRLVDDEVLSHLSPAHSENINFFGAINVDIDAEIAQLGPSGYRPLRVRDTLF